jgi:hypothetical protein
LQVVYLDIVYVSPHMLQVYVLNVLYALDICCIQVFHVASASCFKGMFKELLGHGSRWQRVRTQRVVVTRTRTRIRQVVPVGLPVIAHG